MTLGTIEYFKSALLLLKTNQSTKYHKITILSATKVLISLAK